jgi:O-antigen ligase
MTSPSLPATLGPSLPVPEPRINTILRWMFLVMVFSIPFEYPDRSFPIEIPTLTAALFLFATLLQPGLCYARLPGAVLWFLVYLYAFSLGAVLNGPNAAATDLITPDYWAQIAKLFLLELEAVLVCWAAANLLRSRKLALEMLTTLAVACALFALLPVLGIARTARVQWGGVERITALGQNANTSAMILSAGLIALVGVQYGLQRTPTWRRALGWAVMALIVVTVVETGSRIALLALSMGLTVFALGSARTARTRIRNAIVTALALGFVVAVAYNAPVMRTRFEDAVEHGALAGRERIYPALVEMFGERPLIGWGPVNNKYELGIRLDERIRRRRDAHNLLLEVFSASGLIGGVPFVAGLALCTVAAWRARRRAHGMLPFALLALVMTANMSGNWIASKLLWLVLAYGLASATYVADPVPLPAPPLSPPRATPLPARRRRTFAPAASGREDQAGA